MRRIKLRAICFGMRILRYFLDVFFFSSRRRHTISLRDWSSDVCSSDLEWEVLEQRLRETAYLTKGLRITVTDERGEGRRTEFHYEGGIRDFVAYLNENKEIGRASCRERAEMPVVAVTVKRRATG